MEADALAEMGFNGVTARLKRLSDAFLYQTKEFYTGQGAGIEPNWHMIFVLLEEHDQLTVTEMAGRLGLSHPALVKLTKKMKRKGYIVSVQDREDKRQYQLRLSDKAREELPLLHEYWAASERALADLMNDSRELLRQLSVVEKNLTEKDFAARVREHLT
ncbi:MarR family transcriptional regulator [Lewinella sp. IMCC34191]|uniref:MarR family transcriptional regulator n=1 Tax=Lewinella sp. IMCC34191 TaxID=2259172 RepID=UPI000E27945B|nr:MarR family transcriptional regulator [Lewinella sp. IMCC34191]